ncbi:hypothetical protein ACF0H5_016027 [Mactra antiquata]
MASCREKFGRAFCVTGLHTSIDTSSSSSEKSECDSQKFVDRSETESNTSGYLSSSSFESSGEERRLVLNEQKVFHVWSKWSEKVEIPKSSTPIQSTDHVAYRQRTRDGRNTSLLSIKKDFSKENIPMECDKEADSFWDIKTPKVHKSCSENDVRYRDVIKHDAGSDIDFRKKELSSKNQDWKRKPFLTMSDSQLHVKLCDNSKTSSESSRTYTALPRYRVKMDADPVTNKLAKQINNSCADFTDTGLPVDESMSEFLSNVDRENLAGFLNFYDRMTNGPAYEKARRNPKNYEAAYY